MIVVSVVVLCYGVVDVVVVMRGSVGVVLCDCFDVMSVVMDIVVGGVVFVVVYSCCDWLNVRCCVCCHWCCCICC